MRKKDVCGAVMGDGFDSSMWCISEMAETIDRWENQSTLYNLIFCLNNGEGFMKFMKVACF